VRVIQPFATTTNTARAMRPASGTRAGIVMLMATVARHVLVSLCAIAGACSLPRDAEGTLGRVRGGELRVGIGEHPPWVVTAGPEPTGIEAELVKRLAKELGAHPIYRRASESELLEALDRRQLDLVVGGLREDSPWRGRVALTRPYFTDARAGTGHVFATAAGENGWLVHLERFLAREGPAVVGMVHGQ
jgi:ABC-type amino acid transport substrate-binding protein